MPAVSFSGLAVVTAIAFVIPLVLGVAPRLRLPSVVLEIVAGIVVGPAVLNWVTPDLPIQILALIGLSFLLFLAGLEIDFDRLRGPILTRAAGGFAASFVIALAVAYALEVTGQVKTPLFVAIVLVATSLGIVVTVLKDAGQISTLFGQLAVAGGSIADFGAIILLSLFYSRESRSTGSQIVLLGSFAVLAIVIALVIARAERLRLVSMALVRLQDTTAQIRVRGAFLLLTVFAVLAEKLGLEVILGAFMAGSILTLIDRDQMMTHPDFRTKLEAVGFGVFIPVFFINSGLTFKLAALFASPSTVARVPLFLLAILAVRGLPTLLYVPLLGRRLAVVTALLQSTTLPFVVAASQIGIQLGQITAATSSALIAAGLLSVLIFPLISLSLIPKPGSRTLDPGDAAGSEERPGHPAGA